jgi:hypothetical protein
MNTTIGGSSSMPFGSSRSHRSNQRSISGTMSMWGPGIDDAGDRCAHGPITSRFGHLSRSIIRNAAVRYTSDQPPTIIVGTSIAS